MVYIKRIELSHFKSFGGTTAVPFLPGFTVISGPNGSGKSNILDALLFCLGIATSKGMRAERLPDLINQQHSSNRNAPEASVSVTFDLSDLSDSAETEEFAQKNGNANGNGTSESETSEPTANPKHLITGSEWTVARRLRVSKGGESYTSSYSMNGIPCTVAELHEQLNRLRIYPEGYNVVLQGDVTGIISMNSRERREIIDELAGVAEFDRKIEKTKETLESVREREERCRIIETELQKSLEKLADDRIKAEKYQKLKLQIQERQQWETVLLWKLLQQQEKQLKAQIASGEREVAQLEAELTALNRQIEQANANLNRLNAQVKALGEDEQLAIASQLATQKAKRYQLQQRQQELNGQVQQQQALIVQLQEEIAQNQQNLAKLSEEQAELQGKVIPSLAQQRDGARQTLEASRESAHATAAASDAWVQEQTALNRQISRLQEALNPRRTERAQLAERQQQLQRAIETQIPRRQATEAELADKQTEATTLAVQVQEAEAQVQRLAGELASAEAESSLQQETQQRLLSEQRDKQRQLDRLEATRQAQQEAQGTYASKIILQSDLPGVCGLVAQLGMVDSRYQLALEIAAGARLGHLVVEDDAIAAAGIELLKQAKAGRATFLPLNKIAPPRPTETTALGYARGFIDLAVNLVECEQKYRKIFAYVFGGTVVFERLDDARSHLGKHRMVTLEGEILEASGAMTGGSKPARSSIRFGVMSSGESEEVAHLRQRLAEIEQILSHNERLARQKVSIVKQLSQNLTETRQAAREQQLHRPHLAREIQRLTAEIAELTQQIARQQQEQETAQNRLEILAGEIPVLEVELQQQQQRLAILEQSQTSSEWQQIQRLIQGEEATLQARESELRQAEECLKDLQLQISRLQEKLAASQQRITDYQQQKLGINKQAQEIIQQLETMGRQIVETEALLQQLSERLDATKQERDRAESHLRSLQNQQQEKAWKQEKLQETQQERQFSLQALQEQLQAQETELPDSLPEIPILTESETEITLENLAEQLEKLQQDIRNGQKRLEAMEPVNMLALEEHGKVQERLDELSGKLSTLEAERTELLLRAEHFTTLRLRAFKEAFDAVNENFKTIFATLSEGDGYLQLDDSENPFNGGLNLVAHPKGKPVRRLSSMSGGEKSLTALSFIFSLQRYRPSPFYAFDEVDMFLDGANVERLSKMIQKQTEQAQFIVVSLRRPMIEASERTIGVTQARGAHTQVLGIKLT
jgi:chromosome segregation protein